MDGETRSPRPGDVVYIDKMMYRHFGIYTDSNTVIHFATRGESKTKRDAVIRETSPAEFAGGFPVSIVEFPPDASLPPDEVIRRAYSRLGEDGYNFFANNCDHFATWCKTGEHRSLQVDLVKKLAKAGAVNFCGKSSRKSAEIARAVYGIVEIVCTVHEVVEMFCSPEIKNPGRETGDC